MITIQKDTLVYQQDNQPIWALEINKIKFIGEYTTSAGPEACDWFFVFADAAEAWQQAPCTAIEHKTFWRALGQAMNCELAPSLFGSVDWASSIIFPKRLENQELFSIKEIISPPQTYWRKLFNLTTKSTLIELVNPIMELFK